MDSMQGLLLNTMDLRGVDARRLKSSNAWMLLQKIDIISNEMWLQAAAQARAAAHGPGAPGAAEQHSPQAALQWRARRRVAALRGNFGLSPWVVAHALGSCLALL